MEAIHMSPFSTIIKTLIEILFGWAAKPTLELALKVLGNCCDALLRKSGGDSSPRGDFASTVEGMVNCYQEKIIELRMSGLPTIWQLVRVVLATADCTIAIVRLWLDRNYFSFRVAWSGLLLANSPSSFWARCQLDSFLDNTNAATVRLSSDAKVRYWGRNAQDLFLFTSNNVMDKSAYESFIPQQESTGRELRSVVSDLFQDPELFRLNFNENINSRQQKFLVLWLNIPGYEDRRVTSLQCYGVKVYSKAICRTVVTVWRLKVKLSRIVKK
jgi:hypothetical protein